MTQYVKVGGSWRTVDSPRVKVSGAWRTVQQSYVKVSGTWRTFFQALGANLPSSITDSALAISTANASVTLTVNSNGTWAGNGDLSPSGTWQVGGTAADYEVRLTLSTGTAPAGSAMATWLSCGTTRSWRITETRDGYYTTSFTGTLEIRMAASPQTVFATSSVSLEAVVEV